MSLDAFAVILSSNPFPLIVQALATLGFVVLLILSVYEYIMGDHDDATERRVEEPRADESETFSRTYPLWYSGVDEGVFVLFGYPIVRIFGSDKDGE